MTSYWILIAIFTISLISNALNGIISGASSLIGVSFMLLLGIPPQLTMSTYAFGSIPARLSTMAGYLKSGQILWKYIGTLATLGLTASLLGASLLIHTDQTVVIHIVGIALIGFIPLTFIKIKEGTVHTKVPRHRWVFGFILYFILSVWTSFFAAWTGILCLLLYLYFFGFTILEVKATESVAGLATAVGSIIIFSANGIFDPWYIAAYAPGAALGAFIGVKIALYLGNTRLRALVWLSISAVSIKTIVQLKIMQYLPLFSPFR